MKLEDLPNFTVDKIEGDGDERVLIGHFNHLNTVSERDSYLYAPPVYMLGSLENLSTSNLTARYCLHLDAPPDSELMGRSFAWFDEYWQPYVIDGIVEPDHEWKKVVFRASDAFVRKIPGYKVFRKAEGNTQEENEEIAEAAWDHEHCEICNSHIDPGDTGYIDEYERWLCAECYSSYAEPHDLGFLEKWQ